MAYAHQGVELKPIPGVPPPPGPVGPTLAAPRSGDEIPRPALLTRRGADILVRIEKAMEDASRALPPPGASGRTVEAAPDAAPARGGGQVAEREGGNGRAVRGN
jgi:penicillin-binding protein 1A